MKSVRLFPDSPPNEYVKTLAPPSKNREALCLHSLMTLDSLSFIFLGKLLFYPLSYPRNFADFLDHAFPATALRSHI